MLWEVDIPSGKAAQPMSRPETMIVVGVAVATVIGALFSAQAAVPCRMSSPSTVLDSML